MEWKEKEGNMIGLREKLSGNAVGMKASTNSPGISEAGLAFQTWDQEEKAFIHSCW